MCLAVSNSATYQLFSGADLLEVIGYDEKQIAESMERVEELRDEADVEVFDGLAVLVHVTDGQHRSC